MDLNDERWQRILADVTEVSGMALRTFRWPAHIGTVRVWSDSRCRVCVPPQAARPSGAPAMSASWKITRQAEPTATTTATIRTKALLMGWNYSDYGLIADESGIG